MYSIDYNRYRSISGFNRRVRFIVIHYTSVDFLSSIKLLSGHAKASAHYLIPCPLDPSYQEAGFSKLRIFNLVDEQERAWHAGQSYWAQRTNLNDSSIGMEIVNLARDNGDGSFFFPPYSPEQINAVCELIHNILQRYPDISPTNIVAHSDIAIGRKSDPGPAFPWKKLYQASIGAWYNPVAVSNYRKKFMRHMPTRTALLEKFNHYGYAIEGCDQETHYQALVRAFQLHFRPECYDGIMDCTTAAILYALVDRYFPN